ncbi:MAG: helix-turn-helix transcriptional regulator [Pseudonocardia sp.]|nr:helix-turn-helix transcriptional regulator [Pseudonocardia sp.]
MTAPTPADYTEGLGELVRAHRFYTGLSQRTLADRMGIAEKSLSDIETGRRPCPPGFLDSVAMVIAAFDHDVEQIIDATEALVGQDGVGSQVSMPVSDRPDQEWHRVVIGRAAVVSEHVSVVLNNASVPV